MRQQPLEDFYIETPQIVSAQLIMIYASDKSEGVGFCDELMNTMKGLIVCSYIINASE